MDIRQGIIEAANEIGLPPEDLATIISYESGFRPDIWGGAGGKYYGLIQFGGPERQQYGVRVGDPSSQLGAHGAIANFFKDRGFKPGMGILDAYSTVNAGRPGRYSASDAANGGMPGSVYDKVTQQFAPHRAKAAEFLAGAGGVYDPKTMGPPQPMGSGLRHVGGAGSSSGNFAPASPYKLDTTAPTPTPTTPPEDKPDIGESIASAISGFGGGGGGGNQAPAQVRVPNPGVPQAAPGQVMAAIAPSARDDNYRQQLAALMQQYWIT